MLTANRNLCRLYCSKGHYKTADSLYGETRCKECQRKASGEWIQKNYSLSQIRDRAKSIKRKYGLTMEAYEFLLSNQKGVCAICFKSEIGKFQNLAVDHDHKTGKVRGLLCRRCNLGLSYLDNSEYMSKSTLYLSR